MTIQALQGKSTQLVVRLRCSLIILHVTIDALHSQGLKKQTGGGWVALSTVGHPVWSMKWKSAIPMQVNNVLHDPGF